MILEICPSADIHLAMTAPHTRVVLWAMQHEAQASKAVAPGVLQFVLEGAPANTPLDNGNIRIDAATGEITALQASISWIWVRHTEVVDPSSYDRRVPVRVIVHQELRAPWLGNDRASAHAGHDDLVLTVYAENELDQVVDISGHGFVRFELTKPDFGDTPTRHPDDVDVVNGAHGATDTALTVGAPDSYRPGDLLFVGRTLEYIRVVGTNGNGPIQVARGIGSQTAALVNGDEIWRLGGVDAVTGRVTASRTSAGSFLMVAATQDGVRLSSPHVDVRPALVETAESPAAAARRDVIEPLPFRLGVSGPRRNILLLAEGFTASQAQHFGRFARRVARRMLKRRAHEPFRMLREDYRLWMAFLPSADPGVAVNTRVAEVDGTPGTITDLADRLLQVPDCACGMGYGRRAGEIPFEPDDGVLPPAKDTWDKFVRESDQLLRDWRRLGSQRGAWQTEALQLFAGLRKKDGAADPDYRLGTTWGPGGNDQGLVLLITNEQLSAGTYTAGDPRTPNGYLFGAITTRGSDHFTLQPKGLRLAHVPSYETTADSAIALERVLQSVHELAHGLFLGDEYEDTRGLGQPTQDSAFLHDNLDTIERITIQGFTKFSKMPRVVQSSPLLTGAKVNVAGTVTVQLTALEGQRWVGQSGTVALQTRNINDSSWAGVTDEYGDLQTLYARYPAFRAHPHIQATDLTISAVNGDQVTLTGASLAVDDNFPAGSMLFEPLRHPEHTGASLSLVLPGVLQHMNGAATPLFAKVPPAGCADPNLAATVFPQGVAAIPIEPPARDYQLIGLYEGGGQGNCSIFRPTGQCAMRNVQVAKDAKVTSGTTERAIRFCHVCRYVIVNEINPARHAELDASYPGAPLP